jgi:hypothetical protein
MSAAPSSAKPAPTSAKRNAKLLHPLLHNDSPIPVSEKVTTMQRKQQSRELRDRLSYGSHSVTAGSSFVETIRSALRAVDRGGSKRHRVLYQDDNSASATERLVIELAACGNSAEAIGRLRDAYSRAFDELIARLYQRTTPLVLEALIGEETAINGQQNIDAHEVLTDGSLSDLERLYESTRQQKETSELLLLGLSERIAQTRGAA